MKRFFLDYLRDKSPSIIITLISLVLLSLFLGAFKLPFELILFIDVFSVVISATLFFIDYIRRGRFYQELSRNFSQLEQKYLITEILEQPNFLDGKIWYDLLCSTDKSMREEINRNSAALDDFCDYLELWIHEAKTPISTITLLNHHPDITTELALLDNYLEQILYFARSKNANQDYLFKPTHLDQVMKRLIERNQTILRKQKITIKTSDLDFVVDTDTKWLEFIVNQLLQNSIKYGAKTITINATKQEGQIDLHILDDGIGISAKDLPRVFEKSFTGQNGRKFSGTR